MLDPNAVTKLIEDEIRNSIQKQIDIAVGQTEWLESLEKQIIEHAQSRIVGKFRNISSMPELVATVETSVVDLFEQGFVPDIEKLVDNKTLENAIDQAVNNLVTETISNLTTNQKWINRLEELITQKMADRIGRALRDIDVNIELEKAVLKNREFLLEPLRENFQSTGIQDRATGTQLTVLDEMVVVENEFISNKAEIVKNLSVGGDLMIVGDLAIKGRVNTDNGSWDELAKVIGDKTYKQVVDDFQHNLLSTIIQESKKGISFESIVVDNEPLLKNGKLSDSINESNLRKVGILDNITVKDTLYAKNNKVGINTENPSSALSVWDEEVSLTFGKHSKNSAYIGTNKKQNLCIGVNNDVKLSVSSEGDVWVDNITIGKNSISHDKSVPGYSGTKGDIVFNVDYKKDEPFAWICLGAYRWQELKSA